MKNNIDFLAWCQRCKINEETRAVIENIRSSQPSRLVKSGKSNVVGRYPSRKMGRVIQFESHKGELPILIERENNPDVLELYDQPPQIKLRYLAKSGRPTAACHTPDYFVIRQDEAGWEEVKTEEELELLAQEMPNRYVKRENGSWCCPPGEEYANQLGLYYRICTTKEINWAYQNNITFLQDYLDVSPEDLTVDFGIRTKTISFVSANPGVLLADLLIAFEDVTADDIYSLIVMGDLYVDLLAEPLSEPGRVKVYAGKYSAMLNDSRQHIEPPRFIQVRSGANLEWDGKLWTIVNVGQSSITLMDADSHAVQTLKNEVFTDLLKQGLIAGVSPNKNGLPEEAQKIIRSASPQDLEIVTKRCRIVEALLAGEKVKATESDRTLRRWKADYIRAEQIWGAGFLGLIPGSNRLEEAGQIRHPAKDLIDEAILEDHETPKLKSAYLCWARLCKKCREKGIRPPCYKTFLKAIKLRPKEIQEGKRRGKRAAYKFREFHHTLTLTTPRHGQRFLEIVHIDHMEVPMEFIDPRTGKSLGHAWATVAIDAYTRSVVATYLTYDPPSYRSCMVILQEIVRRYERLPQIIVVDNGAEFRSKYFEALLAFYSVMIKRRPPAEPRNGSVCERVFGTSQTQFVRNLLGNTEIMKAVRTVTKSVNPKNNAVWGLESFAEFFEQYAFAVYDQIRHPALGQSPREARAQSLSTSGLREHKNIPYDETFRIMTLPSTDKGTAKVQTGRGVKINNFYYWCEGFRNPEIEDQNIPVRYDPFNMGIAYAYVKGLWRELHSEHYPLLNKRTEKEIRALSEEIRRRMHLSGRDYHGLTAKLLAEFIEELESAEKVLIQRLRDKATSKALTVIQGGITEEEQSTEMKTKTESTKGHLQLVSSNEDSYEPTQLPDFSVYGV